MPHSSIFFSGKWFPSAASEPAGRKVANRNHANQHNAGISDFYDASLFIVKKLSRRIFGLKGRIRRTKKNNRWRKNQTIIPAQLRCRKSLVNLAAQLFDRWSLSVLKMSITLNANH